MQQAINRFFRKWKRLQKRQQGCKVKNHLRSFINRLCDLFLANERKLYCLSLIIIRKPLQIEWKVWHFKAASKHAKLSKLEEQLGSRKTVLKEAYAMYWYWKRVFEEIECWRTSGGGKSIDSKRLE